MTAHRPRQTGPLDESALIEVLFSGAPALRAGWRVGSHNQIWRPPTDVYETEDQIVVQVEIAGVNPDDFRIALYDRQLVISGLRSDANVERRAYYQMEVHFGEFRSDVDLPVPVDKDRIDAEYRQGFLRVILPKLRPERVNIT
jgi:HSP20 family protein